MINVTKGLHNEYVVELGTAETNTLYKLQVAYGISLMAAMGSVVERGLQHYERTLADVAANKAKAENRDTDEG